MREQFVAFTYQRLENSPDVFVGFLAASAELSVEEAKTLLASEVEAGRLRYGTSALTGSLFVEKTTP
jgi:hypothetical protein